MAFSSGCERARYFDGKHKELHSAWKAAEEALQRRSVAMFWGRSCGSMRQYFNPCQEKLRAEEQERQAAAHGASKQCLAANLSI